MPHYKFEIYSTNPFLSHIHPNILRRQAICKLQKAEVQEILDVNSGQKLHHNKHIIPIAC